LIDPDEIRKETRDLFGEEGPRWWVCLPAHRIDSVVRSAVFSNPSEILEMKAGGSTGHQATSPLDWGPGVWKIRHTRASRSYYVKEYVSNTIDPINGEASSSITDLRNQYRTNGVKDAAVRSIRIKRGGIDMFWTYTHFFKEHVKGMKKLQDIVGDGLEKSYYTLDLYEASEISLDDELHDTAIQQAHDPDFIYTKTWRALMSVKGDPSLLIRLQIPERAVEISDANELSQWIKAYAKQLEEKEREEKQREEREEAEKRRKGGKK
jgi:hypothetical protein